MCIVTPFKENASYAPVYGCKVIKINNIKKCLLPPMFKLVLAIAPLPKLGRLCFALIKGDNVVLLVYIRIITYVTLTQSVEFYHFSLQSLWWFDAKIWV